MYLTNIDNLYVYNLTAAADNVTVDTFGWDPQRVYDALDALNELTEPYWHYFSLQNYTELDLNDYPAGTTRDTVNQTYIILADMVLLNYTIYEEIDTVKSQLEDVQNSIDVLVSNMHTYQASFHTLRDNITTLSTVNVTNAISIIQGMIAMVNNFFTLGDCSFVGKNYRAILDALCSIMSPSIDMLMGSQYLIGMSVIAVIVLVEVLAVRIPWPADDSITSYGDYGDFTEQPKPASYPRQVSLSVQKDYAPTPQPAYT